MKTDPNDEVEQTVPKNRIGISRAQEAGNEMADGKLQRAKGQETGAEIPTSKVRHPKETEKESPESKVQSPKAKQKEEGAGEREGRDEKDQNAKAEERGQGGGRAAPLTPTLSPPEGEGE